MRRLLLLAILAAAAWPSPARAEEARTPHIQAVELIAETAWVRPGRTARVALRLLPEPGWHVYWRNPGDSGLPPSLSWRPTPGAEAGELQWPEPRRIPLGPLVNFGYEGEALFPVELRVASSVPTGGTLRLEASADWLVCKEDCVPGEADLSLDLPVRAEVPEPHPRWGPAFAALATKLPLRLAEWVPAAEEGQGRATLRLSPHPALGRTVRSALFFPQDKGAIENAAPQPLSFAQGAVVLSLEISHQRRAPLERLRGIAVSEDGWNADGARVLEIDAPVSRASAAATTDAPPPMTLAAALAFAFLGGAILNLMPCVFPVLSIKALGLARSAGGGARAARLHALAYAAGVVVSCWALAGALLALRAAGERAGWGFQLQSPEFVLGMLFLTFALGLSLAGVFEIGAGLATAAGRAGGGSGLAGAFGSGVLATALATPCTAPFMGAALGYALTLPAPEALLVFTALGAGVAAPFAALSASPALLGRLPKPGAWMESFKQAMAFPMLAAALWLLWVFARQTGLEATLAALAGLLALACGAWVYGRWGGPARPARTRLLARAAALALAAGGALHALPEEGAVRTASPAAEEDGADLRWEPYSEAALARLRAEGRTVFIDFTAAWCITCQVNERAVLRSEPVRRAFAEAGAALLKADWTSRDPAITRALERYGRSGVPVYALYAPGAEAPELLPSILTPPAVLDALARARGTP